LSEVAVSLLLGGISGYLIGRTPQGQQIEIPIAGAVRDSYFVFDILPASTSRDYETKMMKRGRVIAVWFQFYQTQALLKYAVTMDGASVFKTIKGSENVIALHNVAETFILNYPFEQGANLKITANNTDPDDEHRVRIAIFVEYA
jgi:hypothetical protein